MQAVVLERLAVIATFLGVLKGLVAVSVAADVDAPWPDLVLWGPIVVAAAETAADFVFAAAIAAAFVVVADLSIDILHTPAVVASTNPPTFQTLFVGEQSEVVVGQELHVQPQEVPLVTGSYLTDALSVDFDSLP